jgi:hypothetical protein
MTLRVLLVTTMRWPFAARLAGSFARLGAHVEALCPPGHVLAASQYPARLHPYHPFRTRLGETLALSRPDLVVPCDDPAAQLLARFALRTSGAQAARLAWCLGDPHLMTRLTSRAGFLAEAEGVGAPVAKTVALRSLTDVAAAVETLGLPLVVKADRSWGGDGVVIATDLDAACAAFRNFSAPSRLRDLARAMRRREPHLLSRALFPEQAAITAQPFIHGHPATSSIACWRGALVGAHHFDVVISQGTGPATVLAPTTCTAMAGSARAIARHFNLSGFYGLDYMRCADGRLHLLEINPRATPSTHLALTADPVAALLTAAGTRVRSRPAETAKAQIALFPQEMSRDPRSAWLESAYHDLPQDDPGLLAACLAGLNAKGLGSAAKSATAAALATATR